MATTNIYNNSKKEENLSFKKLDDLKSWEHWYTENEQQEIEKKATKNFKPVCVVDSTSKHNALVKKYKTFTRSLEEKTNEIIIVHAFEEKSCGITRTIFFANPQLEQALRSTNFKPLVNYLKKEIKNNETKNILYNSNLFAIDGENVSLILSSDANKNFSHTYNPEDAKKFNQEKEYKEMLEWFNSVGVLLEIKEYLENKKKNNNNNECKTNSIPENNSEKTLKTNKQELPTKKQPERPVKKVNSSVNTPKKQYPKKTETTEKRKERYQKEKEKQQQKLAEMTQEQLEVYIKQKKEKRKASYERNKQKIKNAYQEKKEAFNQLSEEEQKQAKEKEHERRKREYQTKKNRDQEKLSQMTEEEIAKLKAEQAAKQHEYYLRRKERKCEKEKQQALLKL